MIGDVIVSEDVAEIELGRTPEQRFDGSEGNHQEAPENEGMHDARLSIAEHARLDETEIDHFSDALGGIAETIFFLTFADMQTIPRSQ